MKIVHMLPCVLLLGSTMHNVSADLAAEEKLKQKLDTRIIKGLEASLMDLQQNSTDFQKRFAAFVTTINEGANPNITLENTISLLTLGLISGNAGFVKFLVIKHADINAQTAEGISPLMLSLALLYAKANNMIPQALSTPSVDNYYKNAKFLSDKGAILDTNNLVDPATASTVDSLLKANDKTNLIVALPQLFTATLSQAFLYYLIRLNSVAGVTALLEHAPTLINTKNKDGIAPLHLAIQCKSEALVDLLLHKGADASIENNDGLSAYDFADIMNNQNITMLFTV